MVTQGASRSRDSVLIYVLVPALFVQTIFWLAFAVGYRRAIRSGITGGECPAAEAPDPVGAADSAAAAAAADPASTSCHRAGDAEPRPSGITVIIAARNEERQLPELIAALDMQSHPDFEVLIIDDVSEDNTAAVIESAAVSRPWLRLIRISKPVFPRKKSALTVGIKAATHDILAFTDADCRPPPQWLSLLAAAHDRHSGAGHGDDIVVVGHAVFDQKRGILNRFARYISLITSFQAAATIGLGIPFMAFGTNLSYRKRTFEHVGGYADGMASLSGDDDLFVQRVHAEGAARIVWFQNPGGVVRTRAKATARSWLVQKKRHASSARFFARRIKIAGLIYWLSLTGIFAGLPVALIHGLFAGLSGLLQSTPLISVLLAGSVVVGWLAIHAFCIGNAFCHLRAKDLIPRLPVLAVLYMAYHAIMPVVGFAKPSKTWK